MSDNVPWIVIVVFSLVLLHLIYKWMKDLLFYKANGWDFDQPSGQKMYHGDDGVMTPEREMSNRSRVLFGYPFMIAVFAIVICGAVLLRK